MTTYEEIKTKILLMNEPWTDDDYLPRKVFELCQAENAELRQMLEYCHDRIHGGTIAECTIFQCLFKMKLEKTAKPEGKA